MGQMISSGIRGPALVIGIWLHSALGFFAPCLAFGRQHASATTTSRRKIQTGISEEYIQLPICPCSAVFLVWVSFWCCLSRSWLTGHYRQGNAQRRPRRQNAFKYPTNSWENLGTQKSSKKTYMNTNDLIRYPKKWLGYLTAFGCGLFCALPCLWPIVCLLWDRIQKKIAERRQLNLDAFERRRR